jgi:hypothetical protein
MNVKKVPLTTIKTALLLAASVASLVGCEDKKQVQFGHRIFPEILVL